MRYLIVAVLILSLLFSAGCTTTQKAASIGTLIGAGAGAIIGYQSGEAEAGALVGGTVGAATGAAIGHFILEKE
ncbi:MAG: hypothetical protein FJZ16_03555 [Candidatus Omnitrophica bacterium]|nr:hypothetical protein [Candidatus Omnitrophota bacterium]